MMALLGVWLAGGGIGDEQPWPGYLTAIHVQQRVDELAPGWTPCEAAGAAVTGALG